MDALMDHSLWEMQSQGPGDPQAASGETHRTKASNQQPAKTCQSCEWVTLEADSPAPSQAFRQLLRWLTSLLQRYMTPEPEPTSYVAPKFLATETIKQ